MNQNYQRTAIPSETRELSRSRIASGARKSQYRSYPDIVVLSFGSSQWSVFGEPETTFYKAVSWLSVNGLCDTYTTRSWHSSPFLSPGLGRYTNTVVVGRSELSPRGLLRNIKKFERMAGRRLNPTRWSPRPIDIDIVSFGPLILGWPDPPAQTEQLILPHPRAHQRAFVLAPLMEAWPDWRHPVLGATAAELFQRLPRAVSAGIAVA